MKLSSIALFRLFALAAMLLLFAPVASQAHPGHDHPLDEVDEFDTVNMVSGFAHPFSGMDHLAACLAVGCLAFCLGKRRGLALGATFVSAMALGFVAGRIGIAVPLLEPGLAFSVLAMGVILLYQHRAAASLLLGLVGFVAFWHGNAHGIEGTGTLFGFGMCVGASVLLSLGAAIGYGFTRQTPMAVRYAGAAVAVTGLLLCGARWM
ncbi:MAG TPA: HupE/UreJ family protein [Candidatus Methylacidiphilales bacterium]|nr:HupE/UreJ family protein [Candidatus Methylacidiphilales bacterium]